MDQKPCIRFPRNSSEFRDACTKSLTTLNLSGNNVGEAAEALAAAVASNKGLLSLDLSENLIEDAGASALADALPLNKTLKGISLARNKLTDAGAEKIITALAGNRVLRVCDISENEVSEKVATSLTEALRVRETPSLQGAACLDCNDHQLRGGIRIYRRCHWCRPVSAIRRFSPSFAASKQSQKFSMGFSRSVCETASVSLDRSGAPRRRLGEKYARRGRHRRRARGRVKTIKCAH